MKTAKIVEITKVNEWEGPHGKLYYINMKLDNNELISLGKKKSDAFKVGDTVSYEDYTDDKGKPKQREVKENQFTAKSNYDPDKTNKSATIGMAMKIAFDKLYDKTNYKETIELATRIFEDAMAIYENYGKSESKIEDSTEEDQLPF